MKMQGKECIMCGKGTYDFRNRFDDVVGMYRCDECTSQVPENMTAVEISKVTGKPYRAKKKKKIEDN